MAGITTHVLDTSRGKPAAGMAITLEIFDGDDWDDVGHGTTDDDGHQVRCGGDRPVVGIHVYGADIGTLPRRSYDPATGGVHWFTSRWAG